MTSEWITAEAVEANEFPDLSNHYGVYGVPHTVINEVIHIEGAVPEGMFVSKLMIVMDENEMKRISDSPEY